MTRRQHRTIAGLVAALALGLAALACDVQPPEWTPSPPQQTAIVLNLTYQAQATLTAEARQATPTPTP